jgi:spore maturation protein CgeB
MDKVDKIMFVGDKDPYGSVYQMWYGVLKRRCKEVYFFDAYNIALCQGKEIMNKKFIEIIKKERPNEVFFLSKADKIELETLAEIKNAVPETMLIFYLADDDTRFENFSRYMVLFVDYGLIIHRKFLKRYNQEGIKNAFYFFGTDTHFFSHQDIEKKYDVFFYGSPHKQTGRYETIKFLKDNRIKIYLGGRGWEEYPDLKEIYFGAIKNEDLVKIINQTRINLCFSKNADGKGYLKARPFECGACRSFALVEDCSDYLNSFKIGKDIVMFKDNEDLLKKIRYYLSHEKEREIIAQNSQKIVLKYYSSDNELDKIIKHKKTLEKREFPKINKKVKCINISELPEDVESIKREVQNFDYISFKTKNFVWKSKYKEYLQAYSLEKSGKEVSCCDYIVSGKHIKNFLQFKSEYIKLDGNRGNNFKYFLDLNQIMVTKKFFLENIERFSEQKTTNFYFINNEDIVFVSFPLVKINSIKNKDYSEMKKVFLFEFINEMYSLKCRGRILSDPLIPALFLEIIKGRFFIINAMFESLKILKNKK